MKTNYHKAIIEVYDKIFQDPELQEKMLKRLCITNAEAVYDVYIGLTGDEVSHHIKENDENEHREINWNFTSYKENEHSEIDWNHII